jgi:DNA replication and repair protein RecF
LYLKNIHLINYKNFSSQSFGFDERINCLVGDNGVGKTNVLAAIFHLSQTKSYFNPITSQNVKHGEDFFLIEGLFTDNKKEESIVCSYKSSKKKVIKKNGKEYERFSDHIGSIPLVIISPADRDLIIEGSERRRKFIDHVISQSDKSYLQSLIHYNKVLAQRNALLKYFSKNRTFDADSIAVYDEQLVTYANEIYKRRKDFVALLSPVFKKHYKAISNDTEDVELSYTSHLHQEELIQLLKSSLERDRVLQYTSKGTHRDDLRFLINGYPVKKYGSQGQQKSFLIALKLAQFDVFRNKVERTPILLLDDIFDKLDDKRVSKLIEMVHEKHFGQIFISDTHYNRTEEIVRNTNQSYKIFQL